MFKPVNVKTIAFPKLSKRERAIRAASTDGSSYQPTAGEDSAQINAGTLLVFDSALAEQSISDVSNSLLFAQLAASKQSNPFSAPSDWAKFYFNVLSQVGWVQSSFGEISYGPFSPSVDWTQLVVRNLSASSASLAVTGIKAAQVLPPTSNPIEIWNENALDENKGLLLVAAAQLIKGDVTLSVALTSFEFQRNLGGFLTWNLDYLVAQSWAALTLNEDVYSQVRKMIIEKLGDRPKYYVANVPISGQEADHTMSATSGYQKDGHILTPPRAQTGQTDEGGVFTRTLEGARSQPQIVFPPDTRIRVDNTTVFPWVTMGQLIMEFPNGERYTGTGTLIDRSHVLTAAHNLFGNDIGGWARRVWYVPARNGDQMPYGTVSAKKLFITEDYFTLSPPDPNNTPYGTVGDATLYTQDYGLVRLQAPINLPIFGMYPANDAQLNGPARITGYPGDKLPADTMWTDEKNIQPDPIFLFYRINTFKGQSGAAVIANLPLPVGQTIVGIHVAGDPRLRTNFGVRLTNHIIRQILDWMNSPNEANDVPA